jgi:rubrerythrin
MGILHRICAPISPEERLLGELAELAGRHHELAERLARDATLCSYPTMAEALRALAVSETRHARALDVMLAERHAWSKLPRPLGAAGSSNWQRLSADLALALELLRDMNQQVIGWERVDPPFAERLRAIELEDDRNPGELRELALRCDPQALD